MTPCYHSGKELTMRSHAETCAELVEKEIVR